MLEQTIIWTALPRKSGGPIAAGTTLGLSVFISPRLRSTDEPSPNLKLGDFEDFRDWPKTVANATYEVSFGGATPLPATPVVIKHALRSDVWKALFNDETLVIPHRFPKLSDAEIVTFSSTAIEGEIKKIYQKYGTKGDGSELPDGDDLGDDDALVDIAEEFDPPKPPIVPPATPPVMPPIDVEPKPPKPTDQGCGCGCLSLPLAILRRLLKRIGLIAALPFTLGGFGGRRVQFGPERFAPEDGGGGITEGPVSPRKAAFTELERFLKPDSPVAEPMPSPDDLKETYDFHQMVSTLGDYPNLLRYCGLVVDLEVTLDAPIPGTSTVQVIPTLPTAMTTVHDSPRTNYELTEELFVARSNPAIGELRNGLLRVDDPNRFRVLQLDVAGSGKKLQHTANKVVFFRKPQKKPANEPKKEGLPALQTAGLSLVRPGFGAQLKAHFLASEAQNRRVAAKDGSAPAAGAQSNDLWAEDVLRGYRVDVLDDQLKQWRSLCQRVGKFTFGDGTVIPDEIDEGFIETAVTEPAKQGTTRVLRAHESLFTWHGWSLAARRFGKTILPDFEGPQEKTKIGEPSNAAATQFRLETSFKPKEKSLPRLRFGYQYQLRVRAVDLAGNSVFEPGQPAFDVTQAEVTPEVKYRRFEPVAPPMVMLQTLPVEGESVERLVVRSRFDDAPAATNIAETNRHIIPPKTSQQMAEHHRKFDLSPGGMKKDDGGYKLAARESGAVTDVEDPLTHERIRLPFVQHVKTAEHEHWLLKDDHFDIHYLPDPYARGVLLTGLPGVAAGSVIDDVNRLAFKGTWPDHKPFRLRLKGIAQGAAAAAPVWDDTLRILHVEIAKGETHEVRISSYFHDSDLENMAVWSWLVETGVLHLDVIEEATVEGRTWMHTPFRTLVLVHAVQQPNEIPALGTVTPIDRAPSQTLAKITATCDIDAKSTEKIDLFASWDDPFDDALEPEPATLQQRMRVAEIKAKDPTLNKLPINVDHPIGDTKHHVITYTTSASTRFREYFPEAVWNPPAPAVPDISRPAAGEVAPTQEARIRSSARPAAPKLQYIVPTFPWNKTAGGGTFTTRRRGGGLRVYLDRPWYSTGAEELLGVVLRPPSVAIGSDQAKVLSKYTSEWGMDPLWPAVATQPLSKANFVDAVNTGTDGDGVLLAEVAGARVDVVGFKPEFDKERKLWYCDIMLEPAGAYFPMVRLALVRFQRWSVKDMHISPVVMADFIQVVPTREVSYDATNIDGDGSLKIEINGPTYRIPQLELEGVAQMVVRLERRSAIDAGGELGWEPFATHRIPAVTLAPEASTWRATVNVPLPRPTPLRVVVLELERYMTADRSVPFDVLNVARDAELPAFGGTPAGAAFALDQGSLGYRITFADAIEVA